MNVLIYGNIIPHTVDCSLAFHGFEELNANITLTPNWLILSKEQFQEYDVCVGGVDMCRFAFTKMGIKDYDIPCYPLELERFLHRQIEIIKLQDVVKFHLNHLKFVKPVRPKRFQAFTTDNEKAIMSLINLDDHELVYITDPIHFTSEWRVYIDNNKINAICNYNGDPTQFPNVSTINDMINSWKGPICYVLDVGLIDNKTILVEFNDFYSIGNYGLFPNEYANMLLKRWRQLVTK